MDGTSFAKLGTHLNRINYWNRKLGEEAISKEDIILANISTQIAEAQTDIWNMLASWVEAKTCNLEPDDESR